MIIKYSRWKSSMENPAMRVCTIGLQHMKIYTLIGRSITKEIMIRYKKNISDTWP